MILFVFEGDEREPDLYKTIEKLYFQRNNNNIVCSFGNNIYALYKEMMKLDGSGDIVSVLREKLAKRKDRILDGMKSSDFSEIYLFFDYDFQNEQLPLNELNDQLDEMLTLFNEETDNGKLYVNYPMIESIRYTKELPDEHYAQYVISRKKCHNFKRMAHNFSFYKSLDHILFNEDEIPTKEKYKKIADNWEHLKKMNVCKANFIVYGKNVFPQNKDDINQLAVFRCQRKNYADTNETIAILNSFPLFLYDYLK